MDWVKALVFVVIVPIGYVVQGISGFGSAIVNVPLLSLFVPVRVINPVLMAMGTIVNVPLVWKNRQYLRIRLVILLMVGMLSGAVLGTRLLEMADDKWLSRTLSIVMILSVYLLFRRPYDEMGTHAENKVGAVAAGTIGGIGGALFSMNGPPVVLYLNYVNPNPHEVRAALYLLFWGNAVWQTILFINNGMMNTEIGWLVPIIAPFAVAGGYFGNYLAHRINVARFRQVVAVLIAATAVILWIR